MVSVSAVSCPESNNTVTTVAVALNRALNPVGVTAKVSQRQRRLFVVFEAAGTPNPDSLVPWLRQGLERFDLNDIEMVTVWGRHRNSKSPLWSRQFQRPGAIASPKPPRSKSSQPKSTPVKTLSPATFLGLGILGFSAGAIAASINVDRIDDRIGNIEPQQAIDRLKPQLPEPTATIDPVQTNLSESLPSSPQINATYPQSVTIKAVGDIVPGTNFPDYRLPDSPDRLLPENLRSQLEADLLFGNWETTLTNSPSAYKDISRPGVFAFRTPPEYARLFQEVGFDIVNMANNHTMDFGERGWQDTKKYLDNAGIKSLGEVDEIIYLDVQGVPVAWIGFSSYDGHNTLHDLEKGRELVQKARENATLVVVSVHGGAEGTGALHVRNETEFFLGENRGNMVQFSRAMVDAGADLILGHGPHVPRAMELYKGKLIAYSLGNFIGYRSLATEGETGDSMILTVELDLEGKLVSGQIISVRLNNDGVPYLDPTGRTIDLVRRLTQTDFPNAGIAIDADGTIRVRN